MSVTEAKHRRRDAGAGSRLLSLVLLILSVLILLYPVVSTLWNDYQNSETARRYEEEIGKVGSPDQLADLRQRAEEYNLRLAAAGHPPRLEDPADPGYLDYRSQLLVPGGSTMARIMVPEVGIDLLVYHGTTDEVLYNGAGHMYGTDLPIGGAGRTAVITAHTGMVNASMFDNLHQVGEGEFVYVSVLGERLRYRVTDREIVRPDEHDAVTYEEGLDKLVLITCTPYGINSDRLLVTAVRDDATPVSDEELRGGWRPQLSWWMKLDLAIICAIIAIALWVSLRRRRRQRREAVEQAGAAT